MIYDYELGQEFDISDDGIINVPRIIAGTNIVNYDRWLPLNELKFPLYQFSPFFIRMTCLDADRGAESGWETMSSNFENYIQWLYDSAPNIRSQTSTEAGKAVQRYDTITVNRTMKDDLLTMI